MPYGLLSMVKSVIRFSIRCCRRGLKLFICETSLTRILLGRACLFEALSDCFSCSVDVLFEDSLCRVASFHVGHLVVPNCDSRLPALFAQISYLDFLLGNSLSLLPDLDVTRPVGSHVVMNSRFQVNVELLQFSRPG